MDRIAIELQMGEEPGGIYGLWLRILCLSVLELQDGRFSAKSAESFLYDQGNIFFDYVSEQLGFDPGALRDRIRESISRALRGHCGDISPRDGG